MISVVALECTSRNVFNNLLSKLVSLLKRNEFCSQVAMVLAIEIIYGETSERETWQRAINLAEKLATEYKDSWEEDTRETMGYFLFSAAVWAVVQFFHPSSERDVLTFLLYNNSY